MIHLPPPPDDALETLDEAAEQLARTLARTARQLVLAESCTAGLVAATLGGVAGISRWLCGSAVVYQEATKRQWLGIAQELLDRHGTVAPEISRALAQAALERTPAADLAAGITGHFGPDAPPELDGMIYLAIQRRDVPPKCVATRLPQCVPEPAGRRDRQRRAAAFVLEQLNLA